jgi:tetratricopeptide (TPR) repeat protein
MFRRQPWATLFGLIGTALVLALPARANDSHAIVTLVDRVETAYHGRDTAGLADARRQLLQLATESPAGSRAGYYAAHARFRQALGSSTTDEAAAKTFLDDCITELTGYVAANPADAEARALLGSCYGMSTTHYPLGLVARGMEARKQLNMARDLAPANPWVLMQDGLVDFATPRMFGGSRTAAIAKLERAARLFAEAEAGGSSLAGWALVETWQQLALMYAATGQADAAADANERAASLPRSTARLRQASLQ